jgi:hypothetical protein
LAKEGMLVCRGSVWKRRMEAGIMPETAGKPMLEAIVMRYGLSSGRSTWLVIGLLLGSLITSGLWPHTPLHAVATDRLDTFAIATGPVDEDVEAVYFLDFLTGDLKALVVSKIGGKFRAFFTYNVLADLGVDLRKNPRFLMVTGLANLRARGGTNVQPSRSIVYVAEVTSGKVAAYAVPWSSSLHAAGQSTPPQSFIPLDVTRFRAPVATGGGSGATP